ncbi:lactoylglutathione lyase [Novosphingobium sp. FGD1]|jgi:predicted lactoylglutathione lyase|uniref:Lactoylglutathione lyase n=1 Tax=Novosphingobium silvae TaxID=2692619 RepID=A0A7X4GER8_9SPHN|nr:VOC family protein [Novosphingobium silvae]MYL96916.1 lactoylglutathione lyase [Novosphingobium silvae]
MTRMIFVNLPVTDLERAKAFYSGLGFANEPRFTDDTAACVVWSETIFVMLLTHAKWRTFTDRPIPDAASSEVMLCLSCESRDEVAAMNAGVASRGGTADINPPQDHGFMMSHAFADPDGHVWEAMWMDPAVASGEKEPSVAA